MPGSPSGGTGEYKEGDRDEHPDRQVRTAQRGRALTDALRTSAAARFAFLLANRVILAAGVLKLPSLAGPAGDHIHGQLAVGFVLCGITAYFTVRFLVRYFETRTLTPFAIYSLIAGAASLIRFAA